MDGQVPTNTEAAQPVLNGEMRITTIRVPIEKWKVIGKILIDRGSKSLNKWVNEKIDEEIAKVQNPVS